MIVHAVEQNFAGYRLAAVVLKDPSRRLAMPHQAMAHDEHPVLLAEGNVAVGGTEIVAVRQRVHGSPLEHVLGADGVELRRDDRISARVAFFELRRVQRGPDSEYPLIRRLERGCRLTL